MSIGCLDWTGLHKVSGVECLDFWKFRIAKNNCSMSTCLWKQLGMVILICICVNGETAEILTGLENYSLW